MVLTPGQEEYLRRAIPALVAEAIAEHRQMFADIILNKVVTPDLITSDAPYDAGRRDERIRIRNEINAVLAAWPKEAPNAG